MTSIPLNPDDTHYLRKKALLWRCQRRGTQELDLLLGHFAALHLSGMDEKTLGYFEHMIAAEDPNVQAWLSKNIPLPPRYGETLGLLVKDFVLR